MAIIISQNVVKRSCSSSPKSQVQAEYWMKIELERQALFVNVSKGCPLHVLYPRALTEVYMLCFNRWSGRLAAIGCKTGKWNLHQVALNWMLVKFMGIHWPKQERQIQTCLHTLIIHPTDQRVHLSTQGKLKVVFPSRYFYFITYQFYTCAHIGTHAHIHFYICIYMHEQLYISTFLYIFKDQNIPTLYPSLQPKYCQ